MESKLPRKLAQKMAIEGEQIKLDRDLQDLQLKNRRRAAKKE